MLAAGSYSFAKAVFDLGCVIAQSAVPLIGAWCSCALFYHPDVKVWYAGRTQTCLVSRKLALQPGKARPIACPNMML